MGEEQSPLSSFSWHHHSYNTLLSMSVEGRLRLHRLKELVTLSWSGQGDLVYTCDGGCRYNDSMYR